MQVAIVNKFKKFRDQIFSCFSYRADSTMDLVDALSANTHATSVVQLSLNPIFRRRYGSIRDAITHFSTDPQQSIRVEHCLIKYCSSITERQPFRLMVLDSTAAPRKYSKTLSDKGIIHAPNIIPGNKPIRVGHQYSIMGFLPEQNLNEEQVPWMLPLSTQRVATHTNGIAVGIQQVNTAMPFLGGELTVILGDTAYSNPKFIEGVQKHKNLVLIARLKSNRIFNHKASPKKLKITSRRERSHELWYGKEFNLKDSITWDTPTECLSFIFKSRKAKQFTADIHCWDELLMRQKNNIHLNKYPFRLIRITITDENNNPVYKRAMWLMVSGKQRQSLNLMQIWQSYKRGYDIEHFFKFGKTRLLMDKFQTPDTLHEESWWQLFSLAYAQLYMVRKLASNLPTAWEKYLPEMKNNERVKSARQVQKSFARITAEIGTPACAPKPRVKPPGRLKGTKQQRRTRYPIIIKHPKTIKKKIA